MYTPDVPPGYATPAPAEAPHNGEHHLPAGGDAGMSAASDSELPGASDVELPSSYGGLDVAKSIQDWMREGEELYAASLRDYQSIEAQLTELEQRLASKQQEVNQIAQIIGKPMVEGNRRLAAQLVEDHGPHSVPNSPATIARALAGRQLNR